MKESEQLAIIESTDNFVILKQLPIIEQQLEKLAPIIRKAVDYALSLEVNADTVKEIKKIRAELNNRKAAIEKQRVELHKALENPYIAFLEVYKKYVAIPLGEADAVLKKRIDEVEGQQKSEKAEEIIAYFNEYAASVNLGWLKFEDSNIKVNLSDSDTKLKERCRDFIDSVAQDVMIIESQEHKEEVMVEYKENGLNAGSAIKTVEKRYRDIEDEKDRQKAAATVKAQQDEAEAKVKGVMAVSAPVVQPVEPPEPEYEMTFTVTATMPKLKELKQFMIERGYKLK